MRRMTDRQPARQPASQTASQPDTETHREQGREGQIYSHTNKQKDVPNMFSGSLYLAAVDAMMYRPTRDPLSTFILLT
jgi:hypothetical protein